MRRTNKVVRISYSGGLLGLIFGSARGKLEKVLEENNSNGWSLAEVIPDNGLVRHNQLETGRAPSRTTSWRTCGTTLRAPMGMTLVVKTGTKEPNR